MGLQNSSGHQLLLSSSPFTQEAALLPIKDSKSSTAQKTLSESFRPVSHRIAGVGDVEFAVCGVVRVHGQANQAALASRVHLFGQVQERGAALPGHVPPAARHWQSDKANLRRGSSGQ